jgi:protein-tyrosine-phosphatase
MNVRRVVICTGNGTARAPMAAELLKRWLKEKDSPIEVLTRGYVVQFPEPMNQKAEAVMASDGITVDGFESRELKNEEITDKTLIFTMSEKQREQVLLRYPSAKEDNTFVLAYFVGEELETMNPYGAPLPTYGLCYETLKETTRKLASKLQSMEKEEEENEQ